MTTKKKTGRPRIEIDWKVFETACKLIATKNDILALLNIKEQTLQRRIKEKYDDTFEGVLKKLSGFTKLSLRRNQINLSEKSAAMAIWLGKQYLNQREPESIEQNNNANEGLIELAKAMLKSSGG